MTRPFALAVLLLGATHALAQDALSPQAARGGPEALLGLHAAAGTPVKFEFEDVMGLAMEHNPDLRMAREKMLQAELLTRKAWAGVLPRLNAGVGYTFSWPEVKLSLVSQDQLDAQANAQRNAVEGQASLYDAQANAAHSDGDPAAEALNRNLAASLRRQESGITAQKAPDPITIQPLHVGNGSLNFSFVLFNGRAVPLLLNAYDAVEQTRGNLSRARMQVLYMAAVSYFNAVATRRVRQIADRQVERLAEHLRMARARVAMGTLTELAVQRAEADLTRSRTSQRNSRNAYEATVAALGATIGLKDMFDVGELPAVPALEENFGDKDLLAMALRRPDIKAAKLSVTMADREQWDAMARWLPVVSLNAAGRATTFVSGFQTEPLSYQVVLNATLPLYDGGERYIAWDEAASRRRESRIAYGNTLDRLELAILGNLREIATRKENLDNFRQSADLAHKTEHQAERLFALGVATQLEVVDAQQLVLSAELDLAQAELDLQVARVGLAQLVGVFDPALERVADGSPVVALPGAHTRAPVLAPAGRAASARATPLPLVPSAFDLVRRDLGPTAGRP